MITAKKTVNLDEEQFEDDRGGFPKGNKKVVQGVKAFIFFIIVIILAIIGWIIFSKIKQARFEKTQQTTKKVKTNQSLPKIKVGDNDPTTTSSPFSKIFGNTDVSSQVPDSAPTTSAASNQPTTVVPAPQVSPQQNEKTLEEKANERRLSSGSASIGEGTGTSSERAALATRSNEKDEDDSEDRGLGQSFHSSAMKPAKAQIMKNQNFTIPSGTIISCGTKTELDTTYAGMVSCQVSRDVYSVDHHVRLIDKGAHIDGELTKGIAEGQKRVFVLWTKLRNPDGVVINLESPATSPLGGTGIEGHVDSHFFKRFGSAIMLSVISDIGQAGIQMAGNALGDSNNRISFGNTSSNSSQMSNTALNKTINIPPTLYDQQGDMVAIYVARDLDFSDVYGLTYAK